MGVARAVAAMVVLAAVAAAVVLATVAAVVVLTAAAEDQGQCCGLACRVGRRWWIFVDKLNYLATFSCTLASFFRLCVFVGTPKKDKYLDFYSCYKLKK